ncbi:ATP-binding protein [Microvirga sp. CF3016]|uniref:ATP-binding protein n=1 Tax=Microvirga sp. CF3016 TaxID=3110181 RepID=UPI002E76FA9C|nr:ATP-binding protein [Microvirga sp. CF3016]MEE1609705.1 ATP-binding protein [Microvirga sp. CF3016]
MTIAISPITRQQLQRVYEKGEGHFSDFKAKEIKPAKITKSLSAFANADGGELYIGIAEISKGSYAWSGFERVEDANGHLQVIENYFPLGTNFRYEFLTNENETGLVLFCEIDKTADVRSASDGVAYLRRGAQNLPQTDPSQLERLKFSKGIVSYEDHLVNNDIDLITDSAPLMEFAADIVPAAQPEAWLRKQRLIVNSRPTVGGVLLFSEEPQTDLPKAAIKIYRYKTRDPAGTRDTLAEDPITIEGHLYSQIYTAVQKTKELTENIPVLGESGLEEFQYPTEAIHEVITNAVIHRDYSINDDIHVRIFDNRIEVQSPGGLPGHVTVANILDERFARNPKIVRLLNKFKNPPNKDVGEGLNTTFEAMRKLKFRDPVIVQRENSVLVSLRHEKLGTPEQIIVGYLRKNDEINNSTARNICFIGSENTMKRIFQKMMDAGLIERIPDRPLNKTGYVRGRNFPVSSEKE